MVSAIPYLPPDSCLRPPQRTTRGSAIAGRPNDIQGHQPSHLHSRPLRLCRPQLNTDSTGCQLSAITLEPSDYPSNPHLQSPKQPYLQTTPSSCLEPIHPSPRVLQPVTVRSRRGLGRAYLLDINNPRQSSRSYTRPVSQPWLPQWPSNHWHLDPVHAI